MATTHDLLTTHLGRLAATLPASSSVSALPELAAGLGEVLGAADVAAPPRWSGLTDDCSPFELSIGLAEAGGDDEPVVRLLVEAQDDPASPATYWAAGRRLTDHLAAAVGAPTERVEAVADLFAPTDDQAFWAVWHSVEVVDREPRLRVYLNPAAGGPTGTARVVAEACRRLGVPDVWPDLAADPALPPLRPAVVTVELTRDSRRVGLHLMVPEATAGQLEALADRAPGNVAGDATALLTAVTGGHGLDRRSMFATVHLDADGIGAANLAVPFVPHVPDDAEAARRVAALAAHHGVDDGPYQRALRALSPDPATTVGTTSFATFVRSHGRPRLSVAFGARCYAPRYGWLAFDPPRWWPSPVG